MKNGKKTIPDNGRKLDFRKTDQGHEQLSWLINDAMKH